MARLLAVYGSPRKGGNSSVLLDYFLEGVKDCPFEIERVYLRDLHFSHCTECGRCAKTGVCVIKDDMQPLYDKLLNYERIVISCPVFFLGPPAITKAFLDRAQALWNRKYLLGLNPVPEGVQKMGFLLSVCGFKGSERIFSCNRTIVKAVYNSCGFSYAGELFFSGIDHFGDIKKHESAKADAQKAGQEFVQSK